MVVEVEVVKVKVKVILKDKGKDKAIPKTVKTLNSKQVNHP